MAPKQLANGRWKVTVDVGGRGPDRKRITRTVDTEAEGEALERRLKRRPADAIGRTVLDAVDRYLELYGATLAPSYENTLRYTRATWLADSWLGAVPVDRLDADDLRRYYAEVFALGRSRSTVTKIHRAMSVAFGDVIPAWMDRNPCRDVKIRAPRSATTKPSAADEYSLADVARVLDAFDLSHPQAAPAAVELAELVQAALATGARAGELAGLRWSDVDLIDGTVALHGSISANRLADGPGWHRKSTKTGKPRRMRVDPACVAMFEARYGRQIEQARAAGALATLDRCAVFSLELEVDYTSPVALGERWRRAAAKADVGLRFHDLRHVNASEMTAANVPVTAATKRTGHASNRMFHDVYSHHRADDDAQAVAALAETWANVTRARKASR